MNPLDFKISCIILNLNNLNILELKPYKICFFRDSMIIYHAWNHIKHCSLKIDLRFKLIVGIVNKSSITSGLSFSTAKYMADWYIFINKNRI